MDVFTKEKRSLVMSRIKGTETKLEMLVRKHLFREGFRFRKNDRRYPGKPDILLPKYKTAIFINGCFWHAHKGCRYFVVPKTRTKWWLNKLQSNVAKDQENYAALKKQGWHLLVIWECQLEKNFERQIEKIKSFLRAHGKY